MSIRTVFAQNLRALCRERGLSINAACKRTGIARSQMDRYLNGTNLPNNRNLARISKFFAIDDTVLFAGNSALLPQGPERRVPAWCHADLDMLAQSGQSRVPAGVYQMFFAQPSDDTKVMASLMLIRREGEVTTFRRLTCFPAHKSAGTMQYRGDHRGLVIDRFNEHYFLGTNRIGTREPSFTVLRSIPLSETVLNGHAMVMGEQGPMSTPVVMRRKPPEIGVRDVIRHLGVLEISSPLVGPVVARLLRRAAL